jgi:hypothetical protein
MARLLKTIVLAGSLALVPVSGAECGSGTYEPTRPPVMVAVTADATAFYVEFRARNEAGGFGHSYVVLGTIAATGQPRETVVAGFMPKGAADDFWSKFGVPVTGLVGVARSDLVRRPDAQLHLAISRATYFRALHTIRKLRTTWITYEVLVRNCNNFVGQIADAVHLRTPLVTAQLPVRYVAELRALNAR